MFRGGVMKLLLGATVAAGMLVGCGEGELAIDVLDFSRYATACEVAPDVQGWTKEGVATMYVRKSRDSVKRELLLGVDTALAVRLLIATGGEIRGTRAQTTTVVARFGADGQLSDVTETTLDGDTRTTNVRHRSRPASPETAARVEELGRMVARQCVR
jgi:hypothetical protein